MWDFVEYNNWVFIGDAWQEFLYDTNDNGRQRHPQSVLAVLVDASTCSQVAKSWHVQRAAFVIGSQLASVPFSRLVPHGVVYMVQGLEDVGAVLRYLLTIFSVLSSLSVCDLWFHPFVLCHFVFSYVQAFWLSCL